MRNYSKAFIDYYRMSAFIFLFWLGTCFIFAVFRLSFLITYGDFGQLSKYILDIIEAFIMGFRFDAKVITIFLLPWAFLQLLAFLCKHSILYRILFSIAPYIFTTVLILFYILSFVNHYYYSYFQNHLDIRAFGFIEDDTKAIIISAWQEYPVVKVFFLLFCLGTISAWLISRLIRFCKNLTVPNFNVWFRIAFIFFFIVIVFAFARGTFRTFPLSRDDKYISSIQFINVLVFNGPIALFHAKKDHEKFRYTSDMRAILDKYGYKNVKQAVQTYYNIRNPKQPLKRYYFKASAAPFHPSNKKYHFVLIIMESWSGYYLTLHRPNFNLYGGLDKHIKAGRLIHFPNFFSSQNGTMVSLESLLLMSPEGLISQTEYASHPFPTSIARIFREKNYDTHFVYGGSLSWRGLDFFLPKQGFNKIHGSITLKQRYLKAEASPSPWGVFDQYIFDYTTEILSKAKKPQFITALGTTHHPPYRIPDEYQPLTVNIPPAVRKRLTAEESIAKRAFLSFQYANHALANFIDKLYNSSLGEKVIVAVTGDHNTWGLFQFGEEEIHWKYAVPLMLYLPPQLKKRYGLTARTTRLYSKRFASHMDIYTSLLPLFFPKEKIFQIGSNLLAPSQAQEHYFAYNNDGWAVSPHGAVNINKKGDYFLWSGKGWQKLTNVKKDEKLKRLRRRAQAKNVLLNHVVRSSIAK